MMQQCIQVMLADQVNIRCSPVCPIVLYTGACAKATLLSTGPSRLINFHCLSSILNSIAYCKLLVTGSLGLGVQTA